ncbi:MAG: response regulator [Deltaproteobacteria bacterium]|nr:response regulator [Deltaproteobacteria bacterium]
MPKALIIDDSSTVRSIISKMLTSWGIASIQACNGQEALQKLSTECDIQLALVDWNMPIMNGLEFVKQVRQESSFKEMRIIMVTTETEMHQVVSALEAGVDEYIMKPFTEEIFKEKLNMVGVIG